MIGYLNLCKSVLEKGHIKDDRTGTGTISLFGSQMRFNLSDGFPLMTTKKVHFPSVVHELLWFIKGDTNIKYLVDNDVKIWNDWPYESFKKSTEYRGETIDEFVQKIKDEEGFAAKFGDLGPVYGKQWRDFNGVDQLEYILKNIKENPNSRRMVLSSWNPPQIKDMALPPCHTLIQFYVNEGKISLQLYQRSADIFLGVPFNIASYSLLVHMIAHVTGLGVGDFVHTIGDGHIYLNHLEQVNRQLKRETRKLPTIKLNKEIKSLYDFRFEDIELENYNPHKGIKAPVAV